MKTLNYNGVDVVIDSKDWRRSNLLKVQIVCCFAILMLCGIAEQTLGTLIPKLEAYYEIDDFTMGLTYAVVTSGYFFMAAMNELTHRMIGVHGVATGGVTCMAFAYFVNSCKPPYPIFAIVHFFIGMGIGGIEAGINGWMGDLTDANQLLGILHGCYGLGCMILPPTVTYMIQNTNWQWNTYYLMLAVCASVILLATLISFRHETPSKFLMLRESKHMKQVEEDGGQELTPVTLGQVLRIKMTWLMAISLFLYLGGEMAFGLWLISFLLRVKKVPYTLSLYMASVYWGGVTAGRMILGFVTAHYFSSEVKANWVYILGLTLGFATFLFILALSSHVNSFILGLDFLTVFLSGFITGPVLPATVMSSHHLIPARFQTAALGVICAFGGGGGATVPFVVGLISRLTGLATMPTIITIVYIILSAVWTYVYTHRRMKM